MSEWEHISEDTIPNWVKEYIAHHRRYWNFNAPRFRGKYITIKGKHYRYKINIYGQSADVINISRKPR